MRPPRRGLTVPMAATFPSAASRACTSGIRSGKGRATGLPAAWGWRERTRSRTSRRMAVSSSVLIPLRSSAATALAPGRGDFRLQAAARRKFADHLGPHRLDRRNDVAEEAVHHVFVENPQVPVSQKVHLERLQLQAELIGRITEA